MTKKSTRILLILAVFLTVVTVVGLVLAATGDPEKNNSQEDQKTQITNENSNNTINSSNGSKGGVQIKISPAEAQKIAQNYVKEPGATLGTPQLNEFNGEMVYTVPIQINGTNVGEITINALTGENMGGAGGAP